MGIVKPPFVPIGEGDPADACDGCVAHNLPRPLQVGEVLAIALGLDEELRHTGQEKGIVHRAV
jgi:hypothetical protein